MDSSSELSPFLLSIKNIYGELNLCNALKAVDILILDKNTALQLYTYISDNATTLPRVQKEFVIYKTIRRFQQRGFTFDEPPLSSASNENLSASPCPAMDTFGCLHPFNNPSYDDLGPPPLEPPALTRQNALDGKNREALKIMNEKGTDAAAAHMISMAGGDYATMRMMYG